MTRTTLTIVALLAAGAAAVALSASLEVSPWWALPAVPLTWFGLAWAGRAAHGLWVRWRVAREKRSGGGPVLDALRVAACAEAAVAGQTGFTRETRPSPALERAVLAPATQFDEDAVLRELGEADEPTRRALVTGLRGLQDAAVDALSSPLHPLFPDAHRLLEMVGHAPPRVFGRFRAEAAWRQRREFVDPDAAEEAIAVRLLLGGLPQGALLVLQEAEPTPRGRRIRRLARFLALLRRTEGIRGEEAALWVGEALLLAGRRVPDLVPGSALLRAVPGGPAGLERMVRRTPAIAAELAALSVDVPDLGPAVRHVLSRILRRPGDAIAADLRMGRLDAQADGVLVSHLRGLALLGERRPVEAIGEFESVLLRDPRFAPAAYALAWSRRAAGLRDEARAGIVAYAQRHAGDVGAHLFHARFLTEDGRKDEAREVYEAAIERFPRSAPLRISFAQDLERWGDDDEATVQLDAAHEEHPDDPQLAFLAGRARLESGRVGDAVDALAQAAGDLPAGAGAEAAVWLVRAYRRQGRHRRALPLARELVDRLGVGQEGYLDELAEYLEERHEFPQALRAAERARRLRGDSWA